MAGPACGAKVSSSHSTLVRSGITSEEVPPPPSQPPMTASIHTASGSGPSRRREALDEPLVDGHVAHDTGPRRLPSPDCSIGRPRGVLIISLQCRSRVVAAQLAPDRSELWILPQAPS